MPGGSLNAKAAAMNKSEKRLASQNPVSLDLDQIITDKRITNGECCTGQVQELARACGVESALVWRSKKAFLISRGLEVTHRAEGEEYSRQKDDEADTMDWRRRLEPG